MQVTSNEMAYLVAQITDPNTLPCILAGEPVIMEANKGKSIDYSVVQDVFRPADG